MKRAIASLLAAGLLLSGCGQQSAGPEHSGSSLSAEGVEAASTVVFAMDTVMDLSIYGEQELLSRAEDYIAELESSLSVTDANSEIYQLNQTGTGTLSEEAAALLERGLELCRMTQGALDLSIYPVLRTWGFTTGEYRVPSQDELGGLLAYVGYDRIAFDPESRVVTLEEGMQVDLGSVAKGYAADRLTQLFQEGGVTSELLNLGGNVQTIGAKPDGSPWRVGVQAPLTAGNLAVLEVVDKAVVTSGGYERFFETDGQTYWHIIDPATGAPARNGVLSATIVGDSGLVCDGLSTALFIVGVEAAAQFWREHGGFEAILIADDNRICITEGLEESITLVESAAAEYTVEVIR